jgi:hypothetical protein
MTPFRARNGLTIAGVLVFLGGVLIWTEWRSVLLPAGALLCLSASGLRIKWGVRPWPTRSDVTPVWLAAILWAAFIAWLAVGIASHLAS